ncbi:MAG: hypothetical protein OER88_03770, partial [Planctomycetota bacterium]|nr:hypothetical protein [Planctomycetota bacterium]
MKPFVFRREWGWLIVAVAAATLFFSQLYRLWPLADLPLVFDRGAAIERAREHLESKGYDVSDWKAIAYLSYEPPTLDYLEKAFELDGAREFVREGRNVYRHRVLFKKSGDPHVLRVDQHPASGVIAWFRSFEEDDPGARLPIDEARALAEA